VGCVQTQLDEAAVRTAVTAIATAPRIDCYGVGTTSNFMAADLSARLFRLGLAASSYLDVHLQLVSAATIGPGGVVIAISHVGGMPSLLEAVDVALSRGATVIALTQPGTPLAQLADVVLGVEVPPDPVMPVGPEAYLALLTVVEIVTVLVAQRLGESAVERLAQIRRTLETRGVDLKNHSRLDWDALSRKAQS
jgi:DNA-binding MurR/RpiR family transcriptional regulator